MILIIEMCKNSLHNLEFVKPIEDIIRKNGFEYKTVFYKNLRDFFLEDFDKIIISGTSLKDNMFIKSLDCFNWVKDINKPILGICSGMQILALLFEGKRKKCQEIGLNSVDFTRELLGAKGKIEVYELHNYYAESEDFEVFANSKNCPQAFKHKNKEFYGVLFHPEVRNKEMIVDFIQK